MAVKITRKPSDYISETAYIYDIAKTSKYFDKGVYNALAEAGADEALKNYMYGVAGAKDKTLSTNFNQHDYNYLSYEDKANYLLMNLYENPNSDEYKQAMSHYKQQVDSAIAKETFGDLNVFQKTVNSIGGILGNALNEMVLGTLEGFWDLSGLLVEGGYRLAGKDDYADAARDLIAEDTFGVAKNREILADYAAKYTWLDKNTFWSTANQVATSIGQMVPMIGLNAIAPGAGTFVYFSSMAGNTASSVIATNKDIDYASLFKYTAAVTAVEIATEKISSLAFGGSGIDSWVFGGKSTGKGALKGSWIKQIGLDFLSEGLEESIAEFADVVLYNQLIAQGDVAKRDLSIKDILYAGLVGGLVGSVMTGGRVATTSKLSMTKDGEIVKTKYAKKNKIETSVNFTKGQSFSFNQMLQQAVKLSQTDALADLQHKYSGERLDVIKTKHAEEYEAAVEKNNKLAKQMAEVILGLSRVHAIAGAEDFAKAVKTAEQTFENRQRLLSSFVSKTTGLTDSKLDAASAEINKKLKTEYGDSVSFEINKEGLSALQQRLKNALKNYFGIDVYFGKFGDSNGENHHFGLTINEKTIILDETQFGQMSEQEILNKMVKEELVHSLQFVKGVITPKTLYKIHAIMQQEQYTTGKAYDMKQKLNKSYEKESGTTKLAEAQAKALAEVLLFDDVVVSKMFYTEYSTLNKVYKWLSDLKMKLQESKELRKQKNKIKFNTVLKSMKMYREAAAAKLGTQENVLKFAKDFGLTEREAEQLKNTYLENPDVGPIDTWETMAFAKEQDEQMEMDLGIEKVQQPEKQKSQRKPRQRKSKIVEGQISIDPEILDSGNLVETIADNEISRDIGYTEETGWSVTENGIEISTESVDERLDKQQARKKLAEEQEKQYEFKVTKELEDKANELLTMLPAPVEANYQGEFGGEIYIIPVTREFRNDNAEWFEKLTPEEYVQLLNIFKLKSIDGDQMACSAAIRYLSTWAYEHANTQFETISQLVLENYARNVIDAASQMGIASSLYGENTIRNLARQILLMDGLRIQLTSDEFKKFIPSDMTIDEYQKQLKQQLKDLDNKIKNATDTYEKYTLRKQYNAINEIYNNIALEDWNGAFDAMISNLRSQDANQLENTTKIAEMHKAVIDFFVLRTTTDAGKIINFDGNNRKVSSPTLDKVVKSLNAIETFRYCAMLSSPKTWLTNKLSNWALGGNAMIEDAVAGFFENKGWLANDSQVRFHGDYSDSFSKLVENHFLTTIKSVTGGNKYSDSELQLLVQQYKDAKQKKEHKLLSKIQQKLNVVMNDQNDVVRRTMRNLKSTLAGSIDLIQRDVWKKLRTMYRGNQKTINVDQKMVIEKMKESKSDLLDLVLDMTNEKSNTRMDSVLELAIKLECPLVDTSLDNKDSILYMSLYRANKTFFKINNKASQILHDLDKKGYKKTAAVIRAIIPFVRTTFNTSAYVFESSPIGVVKGLFQMAQTKKSYIADMRQTMLLYYRQQYNDLVLSPNKKSFKLEEFQKWCENTLSPNELAAINGDNKLMTSLYKEFTDSGKIPADYIVSSNPFARAMAFETLARGSVGSFWLALGLACAFAFDFFDYDEDDYIGPCIKIGTFKLGLNDLSPATAAFSVGAMLKSGDNFGENMEAAMSVLIDSTFLSTLDSSISYNQDLGSYIERQALNWTQQYIPAIVKNASKLTNNKKKNVSGNFWNKVWQTTLVNTGIFSWTVPNEINPYTGEPLKYYETGFVEGLLNTIIPFQWRVDVKSNLQLEAERLGATTAGLSGSFTINDVDYTLTAKQKEKYAQYRAEQLIELYSRISNNKESVTIKNKKTDKYETKYWKDLSDDEKKRVLNSMYTTATTHTKIKWWIDSGNYYITSNKDKYYEYVALYGKSNGIQYKNNHTGSSFVEG